MQQQKGKWSADIESHFEDLPLIELPHGVFPEGENGPGAKPFQSIEAIRVQFEGGRCIRTDHGRAKRRWRPLDLYETGLGRDSGEMQAMSRRDLQIRSIRVVIAHNPIDAALLALRPGLITLFGILNQRFVSTGARERPS